MNRSRCKKDSKLRILCMALISFASVITSMLDANSSDFDSSPSLSCSTQPRLCIGDNIPVDDEYRGERKPSHGRWELPPTGRVFFTTARGISDSSNSNRLFDIDLMFDDKTSINLAYGVITYTIIQGVVNGNINKTIPIFLSDKEYISEIAREMYHNIDRKNIIYVHGVGNSSETALDDSIRFSLKDASRWLSIPFLWPSRKWVMMDLPNHGYRRDLERSEESFPHLTSAVDALSRSHGRPISIVAHSRGAYITMRAASENHQLTKKLGYVTLLAPDIGENIFRYLFTKARLLSKLIVTIYGNPHDRALATSSDYTEHQRIGYGYLREYDLEVDYINVRPYENLIGHSLHTIMPEVIDDIFDSIVNEKGPPNRPHLIWRSIRQYDLVATTDRKR